MNYDDHWADTQTRLQVWAQQLGFIDEGDGDEGFRFVLDGSDSMCSFHIGQLICDLKPPGNKSGIYSNLLVYFVSTLQGQLIVQLPRMGLHICMIQPGHLYADDRERHHYDKEHLFAKYQDGMEELIVEHFRAKLDQCRRAQIRRVQ